MRALVNVIFIFVGVAAMLLGIIGVVVPVLLTTPFLLLALYCFARGSKKLNCWFRKTWVYKKYLSEYARTKSLMFKKKMTIQFCANGMMIVSLLLIGNTVLRVLLVACLIIHNWFFMFKIKICEPKK